MKYFTIFVSALLGISVGWNIILVNKLGTEREWNRSFDQRIVELKIQANQTEMNCISELYRGTPNLRGN